MTISLYDATAALFVQSLGGIEHFLKRGLEHCRQHTIAPEVIVETRLYPDMLPFRYQVQAAIGHSLGAIEGVKAGEFKPPYGTPTSDYAALQKEVAGAREMLKALSREEVDALETKDVVFNLGDQKLPFTGEGFLLTFSMPNFYFHATTAYDILRSKGVPLGKRDFIGRIRMKT